MFYFEKKEKRKIIYWEFKCNSGFQQEEDMMTVEWY